MGYLLEICANSVQSAINAEKGGADRVELCDNLWEGGTTPSAASIALAKKYVTIPVFVLIRPRGGDFVYNDLDFEIMKQDILHAKKAGADGIVSGILLPDGTVDITKTKELIALSKPLPFTFHRAFDLAPDPEKALEDIISCGADRILTSGQQAAALDGAELLHYLVTQAAERITIMPGGGINSGNIKQLIKTGCKEFHLSGRSYAKGLAEYAFKVPMNSSEDIPEDKISLSDIEKIKLTKQKLNALP